MLPRPMIAVTASALTGLRWNTLTMLPNASAMAPGSLYVGVRPARLRLGLGGACSISQVSFSSSTRLSPCVALPGIYRLHSTLRPKPAIVVHMANDMG